MNQQSENAQTYNQNYFNDNATNIVYSVQQCKILVKDAFSQMVEDNYDFRYKNYNFHNQNHRNLLQRVYLRFHCHNPAHKKKYKRGKRFTTSKGTAHFVYAFQSLQEFWRKNPSFRQSKISLSDLRDPVILKWDFYLYKMRCQQCNRWSNPLIYQPQIKRFIQRIQDKIADILDKVPPKKRKIRRQYTPNLIDHRSSLCQACELGRCNLDQNKKG